MNLRTRLFGDEETEKEKKNAGVTGATAMSEYMSGQLQFEG